MKPKDIFNLTVRLLGLFFIYLAARQVPVILAGSGQVFILVIVTAAFYVGVAWWLLGGAPLLVKRAYPEASSQQESKEISGEKAKADA